MCGPPKKESGVPTAPCQANMPNSMSPNHVSQCVCVCVCMFDSTTRALQALPGERTQRHTPILSAAVALIQGHNNARRR